jgi:hypothetical protein
VLEGIPRGTRRGTLRAASVRPHPRLAQQLVVVQALLGVELRRDVPEHRRVPLESPSKYSQYPSGKSRRSCGQG